MTEDEAAAEASARNRALGEAGVHDRYCIEVLDRPGIWMVEERPIKPSLLTRILDALPSF
jgi:hypothetical protein